MHVLEINYGRGTMRINVDAFFPTTKSKIRRVLALCREDYEHDRVSELIEMLQERIRDQVVEDARLKRNLETIING